MPGSSNRGTLHFALLGPPQVYHGGQALTFPSRKALALLLYLAVEEEKHSRKTLSELFWPESDAAHARSALRTTVLELRDVLMKDAIPAERTRLDRIPHLHIDRDTLSLDMASGVSLDLHTLQAAWVLAHDTVRVTAPLPEETRRAHLAHLKETTRLSRGEFLDGFSLHNTQGFDDWTRFQREYWHLRMQLVFDRLSALYEDAGEFEQAIAVIIRWLALTLLNEEASQRLMRLHFATGNRVAALQAYETFRVLLAVEIHVEPTPKTMALAARIRATAPAHHTQQLISSVSSPLLVAPFVGRTREYGFLLEHSYLARQGQAQVVLLEGEAGMGKTRLATEFLDWAVAQGTEAHQTTSRLTEWSANLGRMMPLTRLQVGPLSAQDTINLLHIVAQRNLEGETNRSKVAKLVTKVPANFLERVGQRLFAETGGQPFYLIETLKLLLGHGLFAPSSPEGNAKTGDSVATLIKELGMARLLPPSVRELVSIQLDRLHPSAFAFLVAGAVLEQDATFERLCKVADLSEQEGLVALDEVLHSLLVQEPKRSSGSAGNDVYIFTHPMIGEVVSVEAGEVRSRIFHRRALHILQETAVPTAKLAHHAVAAGMREPAFRLSVIAGDEAKAVFALDVAIEHYEQAWQVLATQPTDHSLPATIAVADVHHLSISLGQTYELTRTWEQPRPLYAALLDSLLQMAAQNDQTMGVANTQWYQAMLALSIADQEMAITYGERAVALARNSGHPDLLVQSLDALASARMDVGAWEEYERLATEAHACYVALNDRAMEADALSMLANAHLHRGRLRLGITHARRALTISQEITNVWGQVNALYDLTSGLLDSGAYTEALDIALQAVASARTLTMDSVRANILLLHALIQLGGVYRALQAGSAAREIDLEALTLGKGFESSSYTAVVTSVLCADYVLMGEWAEAQRYAQQAALVAGNDGWVYVEIPHWCVTEALVHGKEAARAQEHFGRLDAHQGDGQRDRVQYLRVSAELARGKGQQEQARSHLKEARVLAEEIGLGEERWQIQAALADLDQLRGEQALADLAYDQAGNVIQKLAEEIEDEALRTRFLTAPQVRHVLEQAAR